MAIEEEVELLAAMFAMEGESCIVVAKVPCYIIEITQRLDQQHHFTLSFECGQDYPLRAAPTISVRCSHPNFTRSEAAKVVTDLIGRTSSLIGAPMLIDICQWGREAMQMILNNQVPTTNLSDDDAAFRTEVALLEVDHMRDQTRYVRTLSDWAKELQLSLLVIHLQFRQRKNHWILVKGGDNCVKTFKKYLRTRNVDVDAKLAVKDSLPKYSRDKWTSPLYQPGRRTWPPPHRSTSKLYA